MVSRNRQCSDNDGITNQSRCLFEKNFNDFLSNFNIYNRYNHLLPLSSE